MIYIRLFMVSAWVKYMYNLLIILIASLRPARKLKEQKKEAIESDWQNQLEGQNTIQVLQITQY